MLAGRARVSLLILVATIPVGQASTAAPPERLDLSRAVVYLADDSGQARNIVLSLLVHGQTAPLGWTTTTVWPDSGGPVIVAGLRASLRQGRWPLADRFAETPESRRGEGFEILTDVDKKVVVVAGNDIRGLVFGVGRLLREMRVAGQRAWLPASFRLSSAPHQPLRGHQLGYRPKTNSYDAWDKDLWYRYIRDLAVFGANAIEIVPPRTDDDAISPHFPAPPLEMAAYQSAMAQRFDMACWIWFPVMDPVDTDPARVQPLLDEWDTVFRKLPRLDIVFVPGGDPGHIPPKPLFAFLDKAAEVLHRSHPKATLWVSPQGFDVPRMDEFLEVVRAEPKWLGGIVFGPQVRLPLAELRTILPARLPIRGYPDITHSRQCQHPVPDWDLAFAVTEGREAINPRPNAMAALVRAYEPHTIGFITYSEGCNDDVNKAIWSARGWDPKADVGTILRQYARYFLGAAHEDHLAQALFALERNWSGPLLTNGGVETTLKQLQDMERNASAADRLNWRFQQVLYRGYYDAYLRDRLIQESSLQHEAMGWLRRAADVGSTLAMREARATLDRALTQPASLDRRARVFELAEALYQSIRMQLSKPKYLAIDPERGANLDTIDVALNDREWLGAQLAGIEKLGAEADRRKAIAALLDRDNPGPGGFHDDLGDPNRSPRLVRQPSPEDDPFLIRAPFQGFALRTDWPVSWRHYTQTFHDAPIVLRYDDLDPTAEYRVRVVYSGDSPRARMRLLADATVIHDLFVKPDPVHPVEFPIPRAVTADRRLTLTWNQEPGRGGNGRGCEVAEVWLIRSAPVLSR